MYIVKHIFTMYIYNTVNFIYLQSPFLNLDSNFPSNSYIPHGMSIAITIYIKGDGFSLHLNFNPKLSEKAAKIIKEETKL